MSEFKSAIVIDNGSFENRVGNCRYEFPASTCCPCVGYYNDTTTARRKQEEWLVGDQGKLYRTNASLRYPIENGKIIDWDTMEKIWDHDLHTFSYHVSSVKDRPVVISHHPSNTMDETEKTAEIMFEKLGIPAFASVDKTVLTLFANRTTSGIVVDIGEDLTYVSVIDKNEISSIKLGFGGKNITEYLRKLVDDKDVDVEHAREIKETMCYVSAETQKGSSECYKNYVLPDGRVIKLRKELSECPEILFDPQLAGLECQGIHRTLFDVVMSCEESLCNDIIIAGGSSMLPGLDNRLKKELMTLIPSTKKINIHCSEHQYDRRDYSTWIGGSIYANTDVFPELLVKKKEYDEKGAAIVAVCDPFTYKTTQPV